ncbi:Hypothetical predicted protein [Xyrichtys novacula]|uniref:Uncharacterized protein n=1 Tax=Xyrichtys novacula TaxID=13765 RepID=A0AAV1F5Q5_XYRNO|nr:Hypothetical predicted protein [Xyrichtys novacula]
MATPCVDKLAEDQSDFGFGGWDLYILALSASPQGHFGGLAPRTNAATPHYSKTTMSGKVKDASVAAAGVLTVQQLLVKSFCVNHTSIILTQTSTDPTAENCAPVEVQRKGDAGDARQDRGLVRESVRRSRFWTGGYRFVAEEETTGISPHRVQSTDNPECAPTPKNKQPSPRMSTHRDVSYLDSLLRHPLPDPGVKLVAGR